MFIICSYTSGKAEFAGGRTTKSEGANKVSAVTQPLRKSTASPRPRASQPAIAQADLRFERDIARAWSQTIPERQRQQAAWAFVKTALDRYVSLSSAALARPIGVTPPAIALRFPLSKGVIEIAHTIGGRAAELPIEEACFLISATYTALVPSGTRSALGMYYTPPVLSRRLLDMTEEAGVDWCSSRVLDPACGGGAFLLPVVLRMKSALEHLPAKVRLADIVGRIRGFDIDPFAAWLTQAWLEIALGDLVVATGTRLPTVAHVCDTLALEPSEAEFDLVVGNPPYARVSLTSEQRRHFARSLYGHANLYGVFTDIALRWAKPGGTIGFVTPTSFLAGEYFKKLRSLLACEAPPRAIDFINARRGVFDDVLQEALLATYRKGRNTKTTHVHYLAVSSEISGHKTHAGSLAVPGDPAAPWLAPREPAHKALVRQLASMPHRLRDWGYRVSTGPLVWNRFKSQLREREGQSVYPLIWAEAVTANGRFVFRAEKRSHQPYFEILDGDEWLKVDAPCVLVQRTTAKEQRRRLIAAELPAKFIKRHGAVVVENHLNMVRCEGNKDAKVSTAALAAVLNSSVADDAFRCISGSVAVSAFELEALPLPSPDKFDTIENLIRRGAPSVLIDNQIAALYLARG